jgi:hypothetical protein
MLSQSRIRALVPMYIFLIFIKILPKKKKNRVKETKQYDLHNDIVNINND